MGHIKLVCIAILILCLGGCSIPGIPIPLPTQESPTLTSSPIVKPEMTQTTTPGITPSIEAPAPTQTAVLTPTPTQVIATATITPTPTPPITFFLQAGTPLGVPNFLAPEQACNWMGIAGQVFGLDGEPEDGMVINLQGIIAGELVDLMAVSQSVPALGPGGYLFTIADHPLETDGSLWMQVFDQAGLPKTGKILLKTYGDCERNLLVVNFVEGLPIVSEVRLPLVYTAMGGAP